MWWLDYIAWWQQSLHYVNHVISMYPLNMHNKITICSSSNSECWLSQRKKRKKERKIKELTHPKCFCDQMIFSYFLVTVKAKGSHWRVLNVTWSLRWLWLILCTKGKLVTEGRESNRKTLSEVLEGFWVHSGWKGEDYERILRPWWCEVKIWEATRYGFRNSAWSAPSQALVRRLQALEEYSA